MDGREHVPVLSARRLKEQRISKYKNDMKQEIIIAGFGGQGVLSMGKILAYSGLMEGKEVTRTTRWYSQCNSDPERRPDQLSDPERI